MAKLSIKGNETGTGIKSITIDRHEISLKKLKSFEIKSNAPNDSKLILEYHINEVEVDNLEIKE